ncbi:MAG: T9SS type A sorting domain-containing protein [Saprospiraceae bacterium]
MKTFSCLRFPLKPALVCCALLWLPGLLAAQLIVTVTATRVSCFGATDGQATANPSGGWFPYTYAWSNGGTTQTIQNLALGTYTVTVSDIDQNTKAASGSVTSPNNIALNVPSAAQTCSIAPDGTASCIPSGGTVPYSYFWSNGNTSPQVYQLIAGTYTVTVTDSKGCTKQKSTQVEDATDEGLWTSLAAIPTSCDYNVGAAHISIMSGTPPYQYQWSNGDTTLFIENLAAGTYTVSVTDVNGCSTTATVLVIDQGLPVETSMFSFTPCGYASGTATINPTAGTLPYQFQWSTGETTQMIDSLAEGTYTATVTDATGCSGTEEAYVGSNFPLSILVQIPTPFCLHAIATFVEDSPPIYPQILWTLSDSLDQIISGQGTDTIKVQWATTGPKSVKHRYGANGIYCSSLTYSLNVAVCADATEPTLAAAVVSPNPFSDFLQIEFPIEMPDAASAVLTDVSGKIVLEKTLSDASALLPTANVPAGFYFLKIKTGRGERVWKVAKK